VILVEVINADAPLFIQIGPGDSGCFIETLGLRCRFRLWPDPMGIWFNAPLIPDPVSSALLANKADSAHRIQDAWAALQHTPAPLQVRSLPGRPRHAPALPSCPVALALAPAGR
jgi:hypothetical protein